MAYRNLDEYLIRLEQSGELIRISHPVHTDLEVSAITHRVQNGKHNRALWFEQVVGHDYPVITNLFGTSRRMAWALGINDLHDLTDKLNALTGVRGLKNLGFGGLIAQGMQALNALRNAIGTNTEKNNPPVQAVQWRDSPTLASLPILRHWEAESAPNITGAQLYIGDKRVIWARAVVINHTTLGIMSEWGMLSITEPTPAAIVLGGDPALIWSASVPLPNDIPPSWMAGWLRNKPVNFARGISQPVSIPADAEFVIEGILTPSASPSAHTLAGHHGAYFDESDLIPFHITAITHRQDAVYPAIVPSPAPNEYTHMMKGAERLFLPLLQTLFDEICDFHLSDGGNTAVISLKARPYGYAHKVMYGLWGLGHLSFLKKVIIVDESVNIHDNEAVLGAMDRHVDPERDNIWVNGLLPRHHQNGVMPQFGQKLGIDATHKPANLPKWNHHHTIAVESKPLTPATHIETQLSANWKHYGLKK
jgi:4-hydroxy-3-polyprenylbenzoate decarboxylase